jgi:hypothetical protein
MHEVSLGGTLLDYLTGEQVERTTYEDLRQALARMLVEEKGYPSHSLRPRIEITYTIDGEQQCRTADLAAYDESGRPLLLIIFCAGAPGTYDRESVAAARLIPNGPAPLAVVTDTRDAVLLETSRGRALANGMAALPAWTDLRAKAEAVEQRPLSAEARQREERILHAYTGFLKTCCGESCDLK